MTVNNETPKILSCNHMQKKSNKGVFGIFAWKTIKTMNQLSKLLQIIFMKID